MLLIVEKIGNKDLKLILSFMFHWWGLGFYIFFILYFLNFQIVNIEHEIVF